MFSRRSNAVAPEPCVSEKDAHIARLEGVIKGLKEELVVVKEKLVVALKPKKTAMSEMKRTIEETIEAGFEKKRDDNTAILNAEIKAKDIVINVLDVELQDFRRRAVGGFKMAPCAWCGKLGDVTSDAHIMGVFQCGCLVCRDCAKKVDPKSPNNTCKNCPIHMNLTITWNSFKI